MSLRRFRTPGDHPSRSVAEYRFAMLVEDRDGGFDNSAIALRGRSHAGQLDVGMHGVADVHRSECLLRTGQHRYTSTTNKRLHDEAFDNGIGQRARDRSRPHGACDRCIQKRAVDHAGQRGKGNEVRFRDGACIGPENRPNVHVLPVKAPTEQSRAGPPHLRFDWFLHLYEFHKGATSRVLEGGTALGRCRGGEGVSDPRLNAVCGAADMHIPRRRFLGMKPQ